MPARGEGPRASAWFSRSGDDGTTGLLGAERVPKYDARPEAFGTVDEAQAALGLARAAGCAPDCARILFEVQATLSDLMAELAAAGAAESPFAGRVTPVQVQQLEAWVAEIEATLEPPRSFVIPGGSLPGAALHLARTVVRRAERRAARLCYSGLLANEQVLCYLNRLSSLLFLMACAEDARADAGRRQAHAKDGP